MGRFYKSRTYTFALDARLTKGDVEVLLLNWDKQLIGNLSSRSPSRTIHLDGAQKYCLHWEFKHASGKCELRW